MQVKVKRDTWLSHLGKLVKEGETVEVPDGTKLSSNLEAVVEDEPKAADKKSAK